MTRPVVAVIGPGEGASAAALEDAAAVAEGLAARGWITLTGGRAAGVMGAAARAAAGGGGTVVGLLPGTTRDGAAPELSVALATGLGEARNAVIATAADALIACGMNAGTASEVALALRAGRPVALVRADDATVAFFRVLEASHGIGGSAQPLWVVAEDPDSARRWLGARLSRAPAAG